jgi:hypothetical protein
MSDFDILEIKVDEQDLVDVPEHLVIFRSDSEDKEEPAKRRKVQMETEKVGGPSDLRTKVPAESVAIKAASSSTSETSTALLTAKKFVSRIKGYKQRIPIVHTNAESTSAASTSFASTKNSKLMPEFNFVPSDDEQEKEPIDNYTYYCHQVPKDDEYTSRCSWKKKDKLPHPVQAFVDIQWQDKLGREYNDSHLCSATPTNMPIITRTETEHLSSRQGPFFISVNQKDFPNVTHYKSGPRTDSEVIKNFLLCVRAWRCLCFDTEGKGMPFLVQPNKGKCDRLPVVFGNPEGQALIFHDHRDIPKSIKDICADFAYVKVQSGVEHDIKLLSKCGFILRGVVNVQSLFALAEPASRICGIEEWTRYVWGSTGFKKLCIPWLPRYEHHYIQQNMRDDCLAYLVQDVLTPYAIVLKLALDVMDMRNQKSPTENVFQALNEAFELCMSKSPADLWNPTACYLDKSEGGKINNWINDECPSFSLTF